MSESRYVEAANARTVAIGGPQLRLRSPGTLVVQGHPRPSLTTSIGLSASGSFWLQITSVLVESDQRGDEVTTDDLRNVRVIELIRENLPQHVDGPVFSNLLSASDGRTVTDAAASVRDAWPDLFAMVEVSHTYNFARAVRLAPVKAVVDTYGVSRSTAHRWINQCREAGMILGGSDIARTGGVTTVGVEALLPGHAEGVVGDG